MQVSKVICLAALAMVSTSCQKKYPKCNTVELCARNTGTGVIHFAWGGTPYTDSIMPGKTACITLGPIDTNPYHTQEVTQSIYTDHGDFYTTVDQCTTKTMDIQ